MTSEEVAAAARRLVDRTTRAQRVPVTIEDEAILRRIGALLANGEARRAAGDRKAS